MLRGRECIIPDISRTFHFGKSGVNMNPYFHQILFAAHLLNNKTGVTYDTSKMTKDEYEKEMHRMISSAEVLDHTKNPCKDKDFIPDTKNHTYVLYIKDFETWIKISECFKIWYLDVRGLHKGMIRLWMKENKLFVVGSSSPYFAYKPVNVIPIFIPKKS